MKKINKRGVFSFVLALMLVFSVGYYSSITPTTAWFTASNAKEADFDMDSISISYPDADTSTVTLDFPASTKVFDADERSKMFEDTVQFFMFDVKNDGGSDAVLAVDAFDYDAAASTVLTTKNYKTKGLHYFFFEYDPTASTEFDSASQITAGVFENAAGERVIESGTKYIRTSPTCVSAIASEMTANAAKYPNLATSASEQAAFLNACESKTLLLTAGSLKHICVVFWVEYDAFIAASPVNGIRDVNFDIKLDINGIQLKNNPAAE